MVILLKIMGNFVIIFSQQAASNIQRRNSSEKFTNNIGNQFRVGAMRVRLSFNNALKLSFID